MRILSLIAALTLAHTGLAKADPALDRIFDLTQLESIKSGQRVEYTHLRYSPIGEKLPNIEEGLISVEIGNSEPRVAIMHVNDGNRVRRLEDFPGQGGNPILMAFLEMVTSSISTGAGGSPFYIRNRIKDAFSAGTEVESAENGDLIVYRPFDSEANPGRLGVFAGLELSFVVDDTAPGGFRRLHAIAGSNGEGYRELIDLSVEGGNQ